MSRHSARGHAWQQQRDAARPAVESGMVNCWRCGLPIQPGEQWDMGHLVDRPFGGRDDEARPEHAHCNRSAGARAGNDFRRFLRENGAQITPRSPENPLLEPSAATRSDIAPDSPGRDGSIWDRAEWLTELRTHMPESATWPRFMSAPHPDAVGSYGPAAAAWLAEQAGVRLRWWQALSLARALEHDAVGALCWLEVDLSTARQVGKSVDIRAAATWRIHQADLLGEEQLVLHTGKDLPVCKEIMRPARVWARQRDGYTVREANGAEEIATPDGSRWLVRSKFSVYGYAVSMGLVDEAWGVAPEIVEDGIEPTMAERVSPQLWLVSTAHRHTTPLFPARRQAAAAVLGSPASTLLLEWSAPGECELGDRAGWRAASPHWSPQRQRLVEAKLARVLSGGTLDPDEPDPVESFRAQFLNQWPDQRAASSGRDEPLVGEEAWAAAADLTVPVPPGGLVLAVEDYFGRGAAAAVAAQLEGGRVLVFGGLHPGRGRAVAWVRFLAETHPGSRVLAGASLAADPGLAGLEVEPVTTSSTRSALPLLRQLLADGQLVHDGGSELAGQVAGVRVVAGREGGLGISSRSGRSDLVRAVAWAAAELVQAPPVVEPVAWFMY